MYEDVGVAPLPIVYGWATAYHAAIESRLCSSSRIAGRLWNLRVGCCVIEK